LYTPADRRRLAVKPGLTCLWQISGRSEIDFSGQVQLDVNYIESQNLWVDVKILAQTVPAVLSGKGAC
jgi:lipopolysaccharide/colanic/teichoic acid biosynthesis glycosyltransferase